ncbi:MAG TPA: HAD family phosphatase, partial [Treponema sp.]|nr:HAD family phosphatase [Treponema sp.]
MKKIEAFVFDMDGILLDTESICEKTWIKAGKEFGIQDEKAMELFKKCIGTNKNDTFNILKTSLGADFSAQNFMEQTSIFFSEIEKSEGIALMPFAKQTLEYLKGKGYRLALASSTRGPVVTRQLKNASLLSFFESLSTGDKVSHSKPDPEIYKLLQASLYIS